MKKHKSFLIIFSSVFVLLTITYGIITYNFYKTPISTLWIHNAISIKLNNASKEKRNKLILISGSNTHFGVYAEEIEKNLGIPSYNLASHAGLKTDYILNYLKVVLKKGDIVIAPLEYSHLNYDNSVESTKRDYLLTWDKDYFKSLDIFQIISNLYSITPIELVKSIYQLTLGINENTDEGPYNSKNINIYGDETANHIESKLKGKPLITIDKNFYNSYGFKQIVDFSNWCKNNNIKFYYTWPNHVYNSEFNSVEYKKYFDLIKNKLEKNNIEVIGNPYDSFYKQDFFYDSKYHLNVQGRILRSEYFVELLRDLKIGNQND